MTAHISAITWNALGLLRWITKAALAVALASSIASAEEKRSFKVGINIDEVGNSFARVAKKHDVLLRMDQTKCSPALVEDGKAICQYEISGGISLLVTGAKPNSPVDQLMLIGGKGTDAASLVITMGLLMGVFDPELSNPDRGNVANKLIEVASTGQKSSADGRDARYEMDMNALGIFFTMEPL